MNKKELITPFLLIGLGLVFAFISFAVFLSNGKSKRWVARKMKIGAILISLSAITSTSCNTTSCYFYNPKLAKKWETKIKIDKINNNYVKGRIEKSHYDNYYFELMTLNEDTVLFSGFLKPEDGEFNEDKENFEIVFNDELKKGNYRLNLFDRKSDSTLNNRILESIDFKIK